MNGWKLIVKKLKKYFKNYRFKGSKMSEKYTEVNCTAKIITPPSPISFICGKEAIEHFGIYEPEYGFVIYLIHQDEIGDWMPKFPESNTICAYCVPDGNTFTVFIKALTENIERNILELPPLKVIKLKGIND